MKQAGKRGVAVLTGIVVLMTLCGCGKDSEQASTPPVAPAPTLTPAPAASAVVVPPSPSSAPVAASSASQAGDSAALKVAGFNAPGALTVDRNGNVYVADTGNNVIRRVSANGEVTTLAGTPGVAGHADGEGTAATFDHPVGIAIDRAHNLYVTDTGNNTIRKITPEGVVTTFAGSTGKEDSADGTGTAAGFNGPTGICVDSAGHIYVADTGNATIRKITLGGKVTTLAGKFSPEGADHTRDGTGVHARFVEPIALAIDKHGNLYVLDVGMLRKITPARKVTTLNPVNQPLLEEYTGLGQDDAASAIAHLLAPLAGVAVDKRTGAVYVAEEYDIQVVTRDKKLKTFVGERGTPGSSDGSAGQARFDTPVGIAVDDDGNLYVADAGNNTIRKVTPDGMTTTLAGTPKATGKP